MKVNFITEFNAMVRYCKNNGLSGRERLLWMALFAIANDRAMYNERTHEYDFPDGYFQVANAEMSLYSTLDKRGIETVRNSLKQRGLIAFVPGMKNARMPKYKLNYLSKGVGCENVPNSVPNNAPNTVPMNEPNDAPNSVPDSTPYTQNKNYPTNEDKTYEKNIGIYTDNWHLSANARAAVCGILTARLGEVYAHLRNPNLFGMVDEGLKRGVPPKDVEAAAARCKSVHEFAFEMTTGCNPGAMMYGNGGVC